ncbi:MAG TPA: ribonuclease R [Stellaceae bacterium]|nr:ribonuclease R [Stellaceae bacterium]
MARSRRPAPARQRRPTDRLPSADELVAFIGESRAAPGTREIARAFGVAPADRPALRGMLRRIAQSGRGGGAAGHRLAGGRPSPESYPEIGIVERFGTDPDGVALARPLAWPGPEPAPVVRLAEHAAEAIPVGARAAARLVLLDNGEIEAHVIHRLEPGGERIVGIFSRDRDGGRVVAADRRNKIACHVAETDAAGARDGELVVAEGLPVARLGRPRARIVERLGPASDPAAISRLTIALFELPTEFPAAALAEAEAALPVDTAGRTDLRDLPLVTIDGSDARDFDDAVWAEPDPDPANPGGWHLVVAIADVAWYVRPGSALDREAERRGNSVYFPDRVVPMLPEALSNELCSLKPAVDRACLAVELHIDTAGRKRRHRFMRAVMRSAARLTYEEIQRVRDGAGDPWGDPPLGVPKALVAALYGAFAALGRAREARGALELDIREDRVVLDPGGRPVAIAPAQRLDSHRLIEEFMVLANVAAAEELEARHRPCMYRIHDAPDPEKLATLRNVLDELAIPGLALAKGQALKPDLFNRVLRRAAASEAAPLINELVLRCQAQAVYSPDNIGHFGLALRRYAHFTSPIRRYADLLVHRALIASADGAQDGSGAGGPAGGIDRTRMAEIGAHISATERRAAAAERAAIERYRATLVAGMIGCVLPARISGVAEFGLFATLTESGATGLVPISTLPGDYYERNENVPRLVGRRHGRVFRLGDAAMVRLVEADPVAGRLLFHIEDESGLPIRRNRRRRDD